MRSLFEQDNYEIDSNRCFYKKMNYGKLNTKDEEKERISNQGVGLSQEDNRESEMSKYKIYDEDDNFIGEFIGDFVDEAKDTVSSSFESSPGFGCLAILCVIAIKFPWLLIVIIGYLLLKLLWKAIKLASRVLWWGLRFAVMCVWWLVQEIVYGVWWIIRSIFMFAKLPWTLWQSTFRQMKMECELPNWMR